MAGTQRYKNLLDPKDTKSFPAQKILYENLRIRKIQKPFLWLEALRSTMMDVLISKVYRFYILEKTRIDSVGP